MNGRPRYIDLPATPPDPTLQPLYTPLGELTPPQTGTIPPALSPLDALAFQGRLLAKKFEQENNRSGRRLSRLPHLTIQNEFSKARPVYMPSPSHEMPSFGGDDSPEEATPRGIMEVIPERRPMSSHPSIHTVPEMGKSTEGFHGRLASVDESDHEEEQDQSYFRFPRSYSPEALDTASIASGYVPEPVSYGCVPEQVSHGYAPESAAIGSGYAPEPVQNAYQHPTTTFSFPVRPINNADLSAPSPLLRSLGHSPSIRSVMEDIHTEDIEGLSLGGSVESFGIPKTPASPFRPQVARSSSLASERSMSSAGMSRPSFNFSRPLSRATNSAFDVRRGTESPFRQNSVATSSTRASLEVPHRHDSSDSPITPLTNDDPHTPVSISSNEFFSYERPLAEPASYGPLAEPSSYTYTKYALPRGKTIKRESLGIEQLFNRQSALIAWDDPQATYDAIPAGGPYVATDSGVSPAFADATKSRRKDRPADITIPRPSRETQSSPRQRRHRSRPSSPTTTVSDASTIKARLAHSSKASSEMTPEQHLQQGIECHESGSLQKSTYHLRLAAKAGLSDAMLLYALACRHGWGMRPNPAEAVVWLQKAVDLTQLSVAEDEHKAQQNKPLDSIDKAKHKAQFALGVYELGMSYSKGWGVKQDKALALRCFEVAGSWGDVDALAEAGFCYAEGVGTKKDMKKAARLYRQAEAKGMSVAGISWIHKDKYRDDDEASLIEPVARRGRTNTMASTATSASKKRDKSKSRFFRKKSTAS